MGFCELVFRRQEKRQQCCRTRRHGNRKSDLLVVRLLNIHTKQSRYQRVCSLVPIVARHQRRIRTGFDHLGARFTQFHFPFFLAKHSDCLILIGCPRLQASNSFCNLPKFFFGASKNAWFLPFLHHPHHRHWKQSAHNHKKKERTAKYKNQF